MILLVPLKWIVAQGAGTVDQLTVHRGLYEAFDRGEDGQQGDYVDLLKRLKMTPDQIEKRIAELQELQAGPASTEPMPCVLNSRGQFELLDGHHRAARLVHDGADFGRVTVEVTSPLWKQMADSLSSIYPGSPRKLYQEVEHPYFDRWKVSRSSERIAIVLKALKDVGINPTGAGPEYLEIGSCTGRFCREFSRQGWRCFGIDRDPKVVAVAEFLDMVFGTSVNYVCTDNWAPILEASRNWAVIVCLSVLHGYHTAGDHDGVAEKLRALMDRCRVLITDGDVPGREYGGGVAWSQEKYMAWLAGLAKNTHMVHHIGTTEGRAIYRCSRRIEAWQR